MTTELDVLHMVGQRLQTLGVSYMLTGSVAMAYYATPRMTRDLDVVIEIDAALAEPLAAAFAADFYVDADYAKEAIATAHMFNIVHFASGIKVDLIVRKEAEYRRLEFQRRRAVELGGRTIWIVSREDLILSKLVWAADSGSELQRRDVQSLLTGTVDATYLRHWATTLGVDAALREWMP